MPFPTNMPLWPTMWDLILKVKTWLKTEKGSQASKKIKTPSLLGIYSLVREAFSSFSRHTCKDARFQHEAN